MTRFSITQTIDGGAVIERDELALFATPTDAFRALIDADAEWNRWRADRAETFHTAKQRSA